MDPLHGNMLRTAARFFLGVAVCLVPILALPWTTEALEFNKQTVFVLCTVLAMVAWTGSWLVSKGVQVRLSFFWILPLLLLLSAGVSSAFSVAPYTSWLGQNAQEYTSFITLFAGFLFFLVGTHLLADARSHQRLWAASLVVSALAGLYALPKYVGLDLPFGGNLIGTPSMFALYLLCMSLVGCALWIVAQGEQEESLFPAGVWGIVTKLSLAVTIFSCLLVSLTLDYPPLWWLILGGSGVLFLFAFLRAKEFPAVVRLVPPMLLFVIALLFLILPVPIARVWPTEISPRYQASWHIMQQTWQGGDWAFGSGPGTFTVDYLKYQPLDINQSAFWDTAFDRSPSQAVTLLTTYGLVGSVSWLLFIAGLTFLATRKLLQERSRLEWRLTFVPFVAWIVSIAGLFLYYQSFVSVFCFWLLATALASQVLPKVQTLAFAKSPRLGLATAFCFVLGFIGTFLVLFITVTRYTAEVTFAAGMAKDRQGAELAQTVPFFERATRLNRWYDGYQRVLANALFVQAVQGLANPEADPDQVKNTLTAAVTAGTRASEIAPANPVNWELRGAMYREVSLSVQGADALAVGVFEQAVTLAPHNPKYLVELAEIYLLHSDIIMPLTQDKDPEVAAKATQERADTLQKAELALQKAAELKPDYVPAQYQFASLRERQGKIVEAIAGLETVRTTNPKDLTIGMQLALLYAKNGDIALAKEELLRLLVLSPDYANAHWYLSGIYQQEGDMAAAIREVEAVQKNNPDSEIVQTRLDFLKSPPAAVEPPPLEPLETADPLATGGETAVTP